MRNGSAALFPLLLAIMAMFWFIWIMGGSADALHRVNKVEDLQHLQERLLPAAMKKFMEQKKLGVSDRAAAAFANNAIKDIMGPDKNKIDD